MVSVWTTRARNTLANPVGEYWIALARKVIAETSEPQHNRSVLPEFSDGDVANTPATSRCAGVDGDKPGRKPRLCASISKQHRAKSDCSVCHDMIDPIGLCMENCDASGTWSDRDGKFLIEPAGPRGGMIKRDRGFRRKPHNTAAWCILTRKPGD